MAKLDVEVMDIDNELKPTFNAGSSGGDYFANNSKVLVYFKNANAGVVRTITIHSQVDCDEGSEHDVSVEVPISGEIMVGFLKAGRFNDVSGDVLMTYSSEADLTIAVIRIN